MAKLSSNVTKGIVGAVIVALIAGVLYYVLSGSDMKKVSANFEQAIGVYPGTPVKILGVNVGDVTSVTPNGGNVHVGMEYDSKYKLPKDVHAILVANSLVSDRYIELADANGNAYSGNGPAAPDNYKIPQHDTTSPAELDDIYKALSDLSEALGPNGVNKNGALSDLLDVASANLKGNGKLIGQSITKLSQAAGTLSKNRGSLFATVQNLQLFTKTLQDSDGVLRHFEEQLAQVASDLASERSDFGAALHQLGLALDAVARFVKDNASKVHVDLVGLRKVSQILVNEKASLDETLAVGPVALANIVHAYQPAQGVIATRGNLASLTDPGQICKALSDIGSGLVGSNPILSGLFPGGLLNDIVGACGKILKQASGGTNSSSQTQLTGSQLVTVVHSATASTDSDDIGGVITGGGQ